MTDKTTLPASSVAPTAAQAVTVVQPAERNLTLHVGDIAAWAVAIIAVAGLVALIHKWLTREVNRDIAQVRHKLGNVITRVDAIEHLRTGEIERIVKLEAAQESFKQAVERVERGQEKLSESIHDRFDRLTESIRADRAAAARG